MPTAGNPEIIAELGLVHSHQLSVNKSAPLVFLVHGRAGDVKVMGTFRRCIPEHFSIISVQAPYPDPIGGFSWWDVQSEQADSQRDKSLEILSRFFTTAPAKYGISPTKVLALGFSQGAGMLSVILQKEPDRFAGVGLLAGFVIKLQENTGTSKSKVFIAHGTKDEAVSIEKARSGFEFLKQKGYEVVMVEDPVGHKVGTFGMKELKKWLGQFN